MAQREPDHDSNALDAGLAAALELARIAVAVGVREARKLPEHAVRWPVLGLNYALVAADAVRREYSSLTERGMSLVRLLGMGDEPESAATPASPASRDGAARTDDAEEAERVRAEAGRIAARARAGGGSARSGARTAGTATTGTGTARAGTTGTGRTAPAGTATGSGTAAARPAPAPAAAAQPRTDEAGEAPAAARAAGAPGVATDAADAAAREVAATSPSGDTGELPIEDFDHLTIASIRARLRRLDVADLVRLREYEQGHANRLQVVTMLENRIAKLEAERAQQPMA